MYSLFKSPLSVRVVGFRLANGRVTAHVQAYGIATCEYGNEPSRRVDLFRTDSSDWPGFRLSDVVKTSLGAKPLVSDSSGSEYEILLDQVECSETRLLALLASVDSDFRIEWLRRQVPHLHLQENPFTMHHYL